MWILWIELLLIEIFVDKGDANGGKHASGDGEAINALSGIVTYVNNQTGIVCT